MTRLRQVKQRVLTRAKNGQVAEGRGSACGHTDRPGELSGGRLFVDNCIFLPVLRPQMVPWEEWMNPHSSLRSNSTNL